MPTNTISRAGTDLDKRTEQGLKRAVHEFESAERKQPRYAAAHAGIASSYILLTYYGYLPPNQAAPRARTASLKALEFDDRLPEAHISLGGIYDGYDHSGRTRKTRIARR